MASTNGNSIQRQLFNKLREFLNDRDFVLGVVSIAETDENCKRIIEYMDNGRNVTADSILELALFLEDEIERPKTFSGV